MHPVAYKLFINGRSATRAELDRIETVTVTQEMDRIAQATIQVLVTADDRGNWTGESEAFAQPFTRYRVEVKVGNTEYVPLIEGPLTTQASSLNAQPGQSLLTLEVQDDSVYLLRDDTDRSYVGDDDSAIARAIYGEYGARIWRTDIESSRPPPADRRRGVVPRGTALETLQFLAHRQGKHAYVLPGRNPNETIGAFKEEDREPSDLPPLVLLGADRNIESFDVTNQAHRPSRVTADFLDLGDLSTRSHSTDYADTLEEDEPALATDEVGSVRLRPAWGLGVDAVIAVRAEARRRAEAYAAHGTLRGHCYRGVLRPYKRIVVRGVNRLSGDYLIGRVVHTLSRSEYTQAFELRRRGRSRDAASGATDSPGEIF